MLDHWVFVLDHRVFALDQWVFVLDQWVLGLRSSFLGLRFRHIPRGISHAKRKYKSRGQYKSGKEECAFCVTSKSQILEQRHCFSLFKTRQHLHLLHRYARRNESTISEQCIQLASILFVQ